LVDDAVGKTTFHSSLAASADAWLPMDLRHFRQQVSSNRLRTSRPGFAPAENQAILPGTLLIPDHFPN
jgi:hypothetical protein